MGDTIGSIAGAVRACHIGTTSHYAWMQHDPEYPAKFADAQKICACHLEEVARVRAIEGMREYKFYKGVPLMHPVTGEPYFENKCSDALLIKLLEANRPEKFGRKVQHGGDNGTPIQHEHVQVDGDDDWYGTCDATQVAEASKERADQLRAFEDSDLRPTVGENGDD